MKKLLILFSGLFLLACDDQDDNAFTPDASLEVNDYIWKSMNLWYFWQAQVPDLSDTRFSSNEEYSDYLESFSDPVELYVNGLLFVDDEFSFITDDYPALVNSQQGIFKTNGLEFTLVFAPEGRPKVLGVVRYVNANTDAASKNISRGEIFYAVNGQELFFNSETDNNLNLFNEDNYTLSFANVINFETVPNGKEISLTKAQVTENPILIAKTLDVDGIKVGYLMYNQFVAAFDAQLNAAFGQFKADGVTELVLDLRYNPGGSVNSSVQLASMITGQFNGQLFIRQRWNNKIQSQLSDSFLNDNFTNQLSSGGSLNSLNLNRVFILALEGTASASELVINGLNPYIDVVHIGTNTTGKNEFSITLVDDPGNSFVYDPNRTNEINPNHTWGIQPLVGRNENSAGFSDYKDGLVPDIFFEESLLNLGVLGEETEPMLARALFEISSSSKYANAAKPAEMPVKYISGSTMFTPTKDNMYLDKSIKLNP